MPFGDGWHPYFNLNNLVNEVYLEVPSCTIVEIDEKFIPTGRLIENTDYLSFNKAGSMHFDTCFQLDKTKPVAVTRLYDKQKHITISIWQQTGEGKYNYMLLYTPPDRNSIAVEPMTCQPDAFNNHKDLIILKPFDFFEASFGVQIT